LHGLWVKFRRDRLIDANKVGDELEQHSACLSHLLDKLDESQLAANDDERSADLNWRNKLSISWFILVLVGPDEVENAPLLSRIVKACMTIIR